MKLFAIYFNSRTHVECDKCCLTVALLRQVFQLTHSRGVRLNRILFADWIARFQLTHSRGVRREIASKQVRGVEFQLTHSRGVRQGNRNALYRTYAFQLTHSRGVRLVCRANHQTATPFQLTHSRGVRPPDVPVLWLKNDFNSRTHVECDVVTVMVASHSTYFNSRTHVECDSKYCIKKRFTTQYMGIYCFLSSIILIFFIYSKK